VALNVQRQATLPDEPPCPGSPDFFRKAERTGQNWFLSIEVVRIRYATDRDHRGNEKLHGLMDSSASVELRDSTEATCHPTG